MAGPSWRRPAGAEQGAGADPEGADPEGADPKGGFHPGQRAGSCGHPAPTPAACPHHDSPVPFPVPFRLAPPPSPRAHGGSARRCCQPAQGQPDRLHCSPGAGKACRDPPAAPTLGSTLWGSWSRPLPQFPAPMWAGSAPPRLALIWGCSKCRAGSCPFPEQGWRRCEGQQAPWQPPAHPHPLVPPRRLVVQQGLARRLDGHRLVPAAPVPALGAVPVPPVPGEGQRGEQGGCAPTLGTGDPRGHASPSHLCLRELRECPDL